MLQDLGNFIGDRLQGLFNEKVTDEVVDKLLEDISQVLLENNVNRNLVDDLRVEILSRIELKEIKSNANKAKQVQNVIYECLIGFVDPRSEPVTPQKGKVNIVVFVGLQGAGKTTSICKYANFYKKRGFRTGVVAADTYRAGALDQIKQNCAKIQIPYYGSESEKDAVKVARDGVSQFIKHDFELILVDTSGRHTQEADLFSEMKQIVKAISPTNIVFVMDSGIGQSAEEQALGFKEAVKVGSVILTKMDGTKKAGGALTSVAATQCPIEFVGHGEGMEDFELFNPERFISKLLGKGDLEGLFEKISLLDINEEEVMQKVMSGKVTLGDFYGFFKQILSLGPLSSIMSMIPGGNKLQVPSEKEMKKTQIIFDSISKKELNGYGEALVQTSPRVKAIAQGSGTTIQDVMGVLQRYKLLGSMIKQFKNLDMNKMQDAMMGNSNIMSSLDSLLGKGGEYNSSNPSQEAQRSNSFTMPNMSDVENIMKKFAKPK